MTQTPTQGTDFRGHGAWHLRYRAAGKQLCEGLATSVAKIVVLIESVPLSGRLTLRGDSGEGNRGSRLIVISIPGLM